MELRSRHGPYSSFHPGLPPCLLTVTFTSMSSDSHFYLIPWPIRPSQVLSRTSHHSPVVDPAAHSAQPLIQKTPVNSVARFSTIVLPGGGPFQSPRQRKLLWIQGVAFYSAPCRQLTGLCADPTSQPTQSRSNPWEHRFQHPTMQPAEGHTTSRSYSKLRKTIRRGLMSLM
jgi:hypothetical protein